MRNKLLSAALALGFLAVAAPAFAASQGDVASIGLRDFNHDGKIDRAVISVANPAHLTWQAHGSAGFAATYNGQPLTIRTVFVASSGDPASLEVVFESDSHLPATTDGSGFEITYTRQGAATGVSDGFTELQAITTGDTDASNTELDQAEPVLLSSDPSMGTVEVLRTADLKLTFSEPIKTDNIIPASSQNPDSWGYAVDGNVLTVTHAPYGKGVAETFGLDAQDAAGNHVAIGSYPNPFSFRTSSGTNPTPSTDTVFALTAPTGLQTLTAGTPTTLAWYTNDPAVADVRLGFSSDGGSTYTTIATRFVGDGPYVWYPPAVQNVIQLKAEALNAAGAVVNASIVNAVSVTGAAVAPVRVIAGPDIARITSNAAKATLWTDRPPESATASCGGLPATVTLSGDRPVLISAAAENLTATPETCRFVLSTAGSDAVIVETEAIAAEGAPAPTGEGFVTLKQDDLIKADGNAAVYWYKDGKRYVFPNEDTYRSWFGDDFSKVIVVPAAQLGSLLIGGNVKLHAGVYLLKIQSDPKTYAVEPNGALRWIQTEDQAIALYGAAWAKRVRDIDVSLFVDYVIGAPLADGERPAGFTN